MKEREGDREDGERRWKRDWRGEGKKGERNIETEEKERRIMREREREVEKKTERERERERRRDIERDRETEIESGSSINDSAFVLLPL